MGKSLFIAFIMKGENNEFKKIRSKNTNNNRK